MFRNPHLNSWEHPLRISSRTLKEEAQCVQDKILLLLRRETRRKSKVACISERETVNFFPASVFRRTVHLLFYKENEMSSDNDHSLSLVLTLFKTHAFLLCKNSLRKPYSPNKKESNKKHPAFGGVFLCRIFFILIPVKTLASPSTYSSFGSIHLGTT